MLRTVADVGIGVVGGGQNIFYWQCIGAKTQLRRRRKFLVFEKLSKYLLYTLLGEVICPPGEIFSFY